MSKLIIESYPPLSQLVDEAMVEGKFVQFRWQGNEYLLFATRDQHKFHNQMLGHFLADHKLPHHWRNGEHLEFELTDLSVMGGGRFRLTRDPALLELWDNSQAYGRFNEEGLADRVRSSGHPFSRGKIIIH